MVRVLVTGASGRLGSRVVRHLECGTHDVVATDRKAGPAPPISIHEHDLADPMPWPGLLEGVFGVVHCGAVPAPTEGGFREVLDTNVLGTLNLLRAALAAKVRKFVFVSTIQVMASEGTPEGEPPQVAYLPLDGWSPANPQNPYSFSKAVGEVLVSTLLASAGVECQSLRLPWLVESREDQPWGRRLQGSRFQESRVLVEQGFAYLSFDDAARLIRACLEAPLPGYRCYLPALSAVPSEQISRYVERYYPDVPARVPPQRLPSLIDLSAMEADTGWTPRDRSPPYGPVEKGSWIRRVVRRFR